MGAFRAARQRVRVVAAAFGALLSPVGAVRATEFVPSASVLPLFGIGRSDVGGSERLGLAIHAWPHPSWGVGLRGALGIESQYLFMIGRYRQRGDVQALGLFGAPVTARWRFFAEAGAGFTSASTGVHPPRACSGSPGCRYRPTTPTPAPPPVSSRELVGSVAAGLLYFRPTYSLSYALRGERLSGGGRSLCLEAGMGVSWYERVEERRGVMVGKWKNHQAWWLTFLVGGAVAMYALLFTTGGSTVQT